VQQKEISKIIVQEMSAFFSKYHDVMDSRASINIDSDKWSLKQILGHLIDSASNNHQRLMRLQIEESLTFPDYKRDDWLSVVDYNSLKYSNLISLLSSYNILLASIIEQISDKSLENRWNIKWSDSKDYISLGELIEHYLWHLREHFHHFENRLYELKNGNYI